MASTFTPNIQLEEPARGDDVGVWDTPVNGNMTLVDLVVGGYASIPLNNSPVVLSAAQFQSRQIVFSSTLTGNVAITFPSSFLKDYLIFNQCTGPFVVTLTTTAAGGRTVGVPPGETVQVYNFGSQGGLYFVNLDRVGSFLDYAGTTVPAWVTACTLPPYLNCDGGAFNTSNYPFLTAILPGGILPDLRGVARYTLNQGTGRVTSASGGIDGNTNLTTKTSPTVTIGTSNLPAYTPTVQSYTGNVPVPIQGGVYAGGGSGAGGATATVAQGNNQTAQTQLNVTPTATIFMNAQGGVSNALPVIGTATIAGITMIRAG